MSRRAAYRILIRFDDGGPWWWRLLTRLYLWSGVIRTDAPFTIYVKQGDEEPMEVKGYPGDDFVTTKVLWKGSSQLVRRTPVQGRPS